MSTTSTEQSSLVSELTDDTVTPARRLEIGDRLAAIGDHREGIGLNSRGVPSVAWCQITPPDDQSADQPVTISVPEPKLGQLDLSLPYAITKYPVTCAQMQAFYDATDGFSQNRWWDGLAVTKKFWEQNRNLPNQPADNMNWYTAVAFTRWLSAKLGYEVRLPTEAQWWYAAAGGDPAATYPWGSQWSPSHANTHECGLNQATAVGMFPRGAAPCGALDMSGNLMEWCINEFTAPNITDTASGEWKPVRGGAFYLGATQATTTSREYFSPINQFAFTGFRLVCQL